MLIVLLVSTFLADDNIHPTQPLSFAMQPGEVVPQDARIRWSTFTPMDASAPPPADFPRFDWRTLRNPILASPYGAVKNQAVVYWNGWIWFFPQLTIGQGKVSLRTRDFKTYEYFQPRQALGAVPRLICRDGTWHALYQLFARTAERRIFYATSTDLREWTAPREAWPAHEPEIRQIDAALAWESGRYYAGFKSRQKLCVTRSRTEALNLEWDEFLPAESEGWCEAYQFIKIDGRWRMAATARAPEGYKTRGNSYTGDHEPFLYAMDGDGRELKHWARWKDKRHVALPFEDWNTVMHANSGYLCDWREHDGWFYLFYAGANDDSTNNGRGHGKIGVARSRDLAKWYLPGEMEPDR